MDRLNSFCFFPCYYFIFFVQAAEQSKHGWRLPVVNSFLSPIFYYGCHIGFFGLCGILAADLLSLCSCMQRNDKQRKSKAYWSRIFPLIQLKYWTGEHQWNLNSKTDLCAQWMVWGYKREQVMHFHLGISSWKTIELPVRETSFVWPLTSYKVIWINWAFRSISINYLICPLGPSQQMNISLLW